MSTHADFTNVLPADDHESVATAVARDVWEQVETRLRRLEMLTELFLAPLSGVFWDWQVADSMKAWLDTSAEWDQVSPDSWRHRKTSVQVSINSAFTHMLEDALPKVLLAMAACAGRTPRDLLLEIAPDAWPSAVDALGAVSRED